MKQKKILFLHGFYASGQCVPALALREAFEKERITRPYESCEGSQVKVLTPDLPLHPNDAIRFIREICNKERPNILVGNSCGSYKSPRADGNQNFTITEELVKEFEEIEAHQFDCCNIYNKERVWGLFGEEDTLAHFEPLFLKHYLNSYHFPGGHTPTAEQFKTWYCPLIEKLMLKYPV